MKEKLSITLDKEVVKVVKEKALENDRSVSNYVNLMLKKHLKIKTKERIYK